MTTGLFKQSVAGAGLNALVAAIGPNAPFNVYDGTVPSNTGSALSGNNLLFSGTIGSFASAAYNSASGAMVSQAAFTGSGSSGYAPSSGGVASFARVNTSGGVCVRQVAVGASGSGAEFILGNTTVQLGVDVACSYAIDTPCDTV